MLFTEYASIMGLHDSPNYLNYYNEIKQLFDEFYLQFDSLTEGQFNTLEEILFNLEEIRKVLVPLEEMGITYDIALAGGAVRDLVLNKTELINDYDFVIHFPNIDNLIKDNKN